MSVEERTTYSNKILKTFVYTLLIIGVIVLLTIFAFMKNSQQIVIEYVEQEQVESHYKKKLIDNKAVIKELHHMLDSVEVVALRTKEREDSILKVKVNQDRMIKILQNEKKKLVDSLRRNVKRVKVYDFGTGDN